MTEVEMIQGCRRGDRRAQKELYDRYGDSLFGVCKRYLKHNHDAEEIFVEGMYKVLTKMDQFSEKGTLYGWMKKIMVNQALMFLRRKKVGLVNMEEEEYKLDDQNILEGLYEADVRDIMDRLPMGYRTVINMHLIEGYKHREIAQKLGISINTSKSQLILAKRKLKKILVALRHPRN